MKKTVLSLLLAAAMLLSLGAFAEPAPAALAGVVTEITDEGMLVSTEAYGDVMVLIGEGCATDASRAIICGDYVHVDYDGKMTRSLPAQVTASAVRMYCLTGSVAESYPEENAVLLITETHGEVFVRLPKDAKEVFAPQVTCYFNGVMTMSLPPQISADLIVASNG